MKLAYTVLLGLALPAASLAVVATTSTSNPGAADSIWNFVGQVNGASAVAIGPHTVLTAAHVGANDFTLAGNTYTMTSAFHAPNVTDGVNVSATDLELINVAQTLPGWYDLAGSTSNGTGLTMVGYGGSGVVNAAGNGYDITVGAGTRRAGGGLLDGTQLVGGEGFSLLSYLRGPGGAALVGGDSGGGWFDSSGKLIGINVFYFNDTDLGPTPPGDTAPPPMLPNYGFPNANPGWSFHNSQPGWDWNIDIAPGTPYFGSGAIDVTNATIQSWIRTNAVPEPASMLALGIGVAAVLRRRRK